jgi:hypothetical protein
VVREAVTTSTFEASTLKLMLAESPASVTLRVLPAPATPEKVTPDGTRGLPAAKSTVNVVPAEMLLTAIDETLARNTDWFGEPVSVVPFQTSRCCPSRSSRKQNAGPVRLTDVAPVVVEMVKVTADDFAVE